MDQTRTKSVVSGWDAPVEASNVEATNVQNVQREFIDNSSTATIARDETSLSAEDDIAMRVSAAPRDVQRTVASIVDVAGGPDGGAVLSNIKGARNTVDLALLTSYLATPEQLEEADVPWSEEGILNELSATALAGGAVWRSASDPNNSKDRPLQTIQSSTAAQLGMATTGGRVRGAESRTTTAMLSSGNGSNHAGGSRLESNEAMRASKPMPTAGRRAV